MTDGGHLEKTLLNWLAFHPLQGANETVYNHLKALGEQEWSLETTKLKWRSMDHLIKRETGASENCTSSVVSLFDLAAKASVRHVGLIEANSERIPLVLYSSLLEASIKTDRILSVRHLLLSWPYRKLCLVDCKEFTKQHAVTLAHSLKTGCNKLREVDLTGCNIGVLGTTLLLRLAAGQPLSNVMEYCSNQEATQHLPQHRLSITTDCYVSPDNYLQLVDVLERKTKLHKFTVSYFYAVELGAKRINKVLWNLRHIQAGSVIGLDFQLNNVICPQGFQGGGLFYGYFNNFLNLKHLNLSMNMCTQDILFDFLKCISAPLKCLLLNGVAIDGMDLPNWDFNEMMKVSCMQKLEHLELRSNYLREVGPGIMNLLNNCSGTLSYLSLESNFLTDTSVPALLQLMEDPFTLTKLCIGGNMFSPAAEKQLFEKDKYSIIVKTPSLYANIYHR